MVPVWVPFKIVSVSTVLYPRWPLLLKIEISSNGQNCSILSQNVPKFELYKHNELYSSPDSKGHVSYCHHWASVVCHPSSVRLLTFHILINSSEATGPIWTKLWWNGPWMAPFEICVRWSRLPTKMATKLKIEKGGMKF